jgi:hypothetical protein
MNAKADALHEDWWRVDKLQRDHFSRLIGRAWTHFKWVKAEKKRKKALKKGKGKKKKKKKKKVQPDAVTDADGMANINTTLGMDDEDPEGDMDGDMEGDMEGDNEEGDKGEGEDEGASPDKEDGESPSKSPRDGEHDENEDGSRSPKNNLLSIASANK